MTTEQVVVEEEAQVEEESAEPTEGTRLCQKVHNFDLPVCGSPVVEGGCELYPPASDN